MVSMRLAILLLATGGASVAIAQVASGPINLELGHGFPWEGLSLFTIVMALVYAGHVAQDRTGLGWRVLLFILGFPLTFIASFLVYPGSNRLLGVHLPPRSAETGRPRSTESASGEGEAGQRERRAAWQHTVSILIGVSVVFLLAPSTQYRTEPVSDEQFAVEETVYRGFGDTPWLSYRRDGMLSLSGDSNWTAPEWTTERQWHFEASPETVLTLIALLVVFLLCLRDEVLRSRQDGDSQSSS